MKTSSDIAFSALSGFFVLSGITTWLVMISGWVGWIDLMTGAIGILIAGLCAYSDRGDKKESRMYATAAWASCKTHEERTINVCQCAYFWIYSPLLAWLLSPVTFVQSILYLYNKPQASGAVSWVVVTLIAWQIAAISTNFSHHRIFAHRSFKAPRALEFMFAILGTLTMRGPLWFTSSHRHHHRDCDGPRDPHSVVSRGLWYAHMGWIFDKTCALINFDDVGSLRRRPELMLVDLLYPTIWQLTSGAIYYCSGFSIEDAIRINLMAAFLALHVEFCINSVCHDDHNDDMGESKCMPLDRWWVALLNGGEGWHAQHHRYPRLPCMSTKWYQLDIIYVYALMLERFGLLTMLVKRA